MSAVRAEPSGFPAKVFPDPRVTPFPDMLQVFLSQRFVQRFVKLEYAQLFRMAHGMHVFKPFERHTPVLQNAVQNAD